MSWRIAIIIFIFICSLTPAQKLQFNSSDVFGTHCFIENKGQYSGIKGINSPVFFAYEAGNVVIYFTANGLVYRYTKIQELSAQQQKLLEKGFPIPVKKDVEETIYASWKDVSADMRIEATNKTDHYFTYGTKEKNANGYKKIIYKNVFESIDIEYLVSEQSSDGIKYNVILHKGAEAQDIRTIYTGDVNLLNITDEGELKIGSGAFDLKETIPVSYYADTKQPIKSKFKLQGNCVSFVLHKADKNREIVIDPWITNLTTMNAGFDVDYDFAGNLYVIGLVGVPMKVAKYNSAGALQWTFNCQLTSISWPLFSATNFIVNKTTGKTYIGEKANYQNGVTIIRIDGAGNHDLSSVPTVNFNECWDLAYRCNDGAIVPLGGHNYSSVSTLDEVTGNLTPTFYNSTVSDVGDAAFDDAGNLFLHRTDNVIQRIGFNLTTLNWFNTTSYSTFAYLSQKANYTSGGGPGQGFNCIAVNNNCFLYYDGYNLAAYNKNTGGLFASTTISGYTIGRQGGIDVDNCNNIYLGGENGNILKYHLSGTSLSPQGTITLNPATSTKYIYDLKLNSLANSLYYAGTGFAGIYALSNGTCVLSNVCMNIPPVSTVACSGSTVNFYINSLGYLTNPTFSLMPGNITSASSVVAVSPTVNTTYTVYITGLNSQNQIQTMTTTATASVIPGPVLSPTVINGTCANPVTSSVNLNVTFNPAASVNYTCVWSPLPGTVTTVNSGTASGLAPGITNVTVVTAAGCSATTSFSVPPVPLPASFVIVNPNNDYTLTCINPNVVLTTSITNGVPLSFTWFPSCTGSVVATGVNFSQPCIGQVIGTSSTGCTMTQTFAIVQDLSTPTIVITPTISNITCAGGSGCFTLTSNLGPNVTTNWYQIAGTNTAYVGVPQGTINVFCAGSPGVYWGESVYNITGCKVTQSVQVTASVGVPTFTLTSPTNFTIGCGSKSVTSMQVSSVVTSPVPNVPVNYTFMIPPVTGTPTTFTTNPNLNGIIIPGTYVVYVKNLTNNCVSSQSVSIIQNTLVPNINFIQPLAQLSCRDFSIVLTGISSNTNTQITWTVPAFPGSSVNPSPNATVVTMPSITGATANVVAIGIWTVGVLDNTNFCTNTRTVQINQDIRLPRFTISALSNSVITCKNPDVVIVPVVTPTLAVALVPTYVWYPPIGAALPGTQYNTTAAGTHTAISTSVVNGCTTSATYIVATDLTPPALSPSGVFTLDCAANPTTVLSPSITGSTAGFTYSWSIQPGALTSNVTASALTTNMPGFYAVLITNTVNGCSSASGYEVVRGEINAAFTPQPDFGFAPLNVNFINESSTSTGATSIICTWGYGNGAVTPTVYNTTQTSTTYTAAGTYQVMLKVKKGACEDYVMKLVKVELPSAIEVPNVFTPNGDKVNDVFRLRASSLREVSISIYDRWGNLVYEVVSSTGNFAWDGKNQFGKECAAGTYFYILKAKGEDAKEFEMKGNVSLFR